MLDWLFIILLMMAIMFTLLSIITDWGIYWNVVFIIGAIILFFTLGAGIMSIETPYTMYNATSGNIEEGFHTTQSSVSPYMAYVFNFMAIAMMLYFVGYIFYPAIKKAWMR